MDNEEKIKKWYNKLANAGRPDEYEVKSLLREVGISVPKGKRYASDEKIVPPEFSPPFVLKVCSGDIMHKTDLGGVRLNVDIKSLEDSAAGMLSRFPVQSLLVEEQIRPESIEFIVGGMVDPDFGPSVMIGVGGILTELYKDVAFRLIPCSAKEAGRMIEELKVSPVFTGFRGLEINREGFVELITAVSNLIESLGERFDQLDLNPVVFSKGQWVALDAKLILSDMIMW
jgi:succinyl-CoA synthetase beta subunit